MSQPTGNNGYDVSPLFQPSQTDTAIQMLHDIFGGTVDKLIGGGGSSAYAGSSVVLTVIGCFNLLVLFLAVCVGSYLIYASVINTAKDGEVLGRNADARWTSIKAFLAIFGLVPTASGLSIVQVCALQFIVWSSAAGTYTWGKAAQFLANQSSSYISTSDSEFTNWAQRGNVANALQAMVKGHVCAYYANRIAQNTQSGSNPLTETVVTSPVGFFDATADRATGNEGIVEWGFTSDASYNKLSSMCGRVRIYYAPPDPATTSGSMASTSATYQEKLAALAEQNTQSAALAVLAQLDTQASTIAREIYDGSPDTNAIKQQIMSAVSAATGTFYGNFNVSTSDASQLGQDFMNSITDDGWVWAALWQRSLSQFAVEAKGVKNSVQFDIDDSVSPKSAGSLSAQYFGWAGGGSAEEKAMFANIDRDLAYFNNFSGTFTNAGSPVQQPQGSNLEKVEAADHEASGIAPIRWLVSYMRRTLMPQETQGWTDPFLQIQDYGAWYVRSGTKIMAVGAVSGMGMAAAATAAMGPEAAIGGYEVGKSLGSILSPIGKAMILFGMILLVVLPFLPVLFFAAGVIGWVIMGIEAIVAISLWCLLGLVATPGSGLVGDNRQGLLLLIGVVLRPILMILGLISCYVVLYVSIKFLNSVFAVAFLIMNFGGTIDSMLGAVGLLGIYVLACAAAVTTSCSLITGLGDAVMQWIGGGVSQLGGSAIANNVAQQLNPIGRIGNSVALLHKGDTSSKAMLTGSMSKVENFAVKKLGPKK